MENSDNAKKTPAVISKYSKRFLALIIDATVLGTLGIILGFLFTHTFIQLGWKGRFIGFGISFLYFTLSNSFILEGQTIGQKALKIKVVDFKGKSLSIGKSALRSLFLPLITLLNNWPVPVDYKSIILQFIAFILFSLIFSEMYFFIFSGRSKQLLHDTITGTYVINATNENHNIELTLINKNVIMFSFFPIVIVIAIFFLVNLFSKQEQMTELLSIQTDVAKITGLNNVKVYSGSTTFKNIGNDSNTIKYLRISSLLMTEETKNDDLSQKIVKLLSKYSISKDVDTIELQYVTGYDIGIASKWKSATQKYTKDEYLKLISE